MRDFPAYLAQIRQHLEGLEVHWCLIGGLAVGALTEPRFTKDLDLAVATVDDQSSEGLIFALRGAGYRILAILEQQVSGRLATARLSPPDANEPVVIDLLFASSGIESEIVARATTTEVFPGVWVPVASLGDLIAMKVLARDDDRRPQDRLDLKALLERSQASDIAIAQTALQGISRLGLDRGRPLLEDLRQAEREFSKGTSIRDENCPL